MTEIQQPTNERSIFSVSELNKMVHDLLEHQFPSIWVEGELSNFSRPSSGHWYFTLKDANAQVRSAMFRFANQKITFAPKDGQKVLVRGRLSLYQNRGDYQLVADQMEEAGLGALQRAFEALKKQLLAEGLFDPAHKKPIPAFPSCIGVVTSSTGAAIRDILTVLKRRYPLASVIIYPVMVQGEQAAGQISRAIAAANDRKECDVLIIGRGGGSLEDLWPFNEEIVARAIYDSELPIVSGVGHEVDTTISDYVADQRAATPSAAAELISPDQNKLLQQFHQYQSRLKQYIARAYAQKRDALLYLEKRLEQTHPLFLLQQQSQRLDFLQHKLTTVIVHSFEQKKSQWLQLASKLQQFHPKHRLEHMQYQFAALEKKLQQTILHKLQILQSRFQSLTRTLNAMSPLAVLARGYSVITTAENTILKDASQVKKGDHIQARLAQGSIECEVLD